MRIDDPRFNRINRFFTNGLSLVEYAALLVIGFATTVAALNEVLTMVHARHVGLPDLLLMFLYLEVFAMIGQYFRTGKLPVRYPLYIAIVALARYLILETKTLTEVKFLAVSASILILAIAVFVIRYGHVKFPYEKDHEGGRE